MVLVINSGACKMENEKNQSSKQSSVDVAQDDEKPDFEQLEAATTATPAFPEPVTFKLVFKKSFDGFPEPALIKMEPSSRPPTPNVTTCYFPPDEGCVVFNENMVKRGSSVEVEIGSCSSSESPGHSMQSGSSADSTPQKAPPLTSAAPAPPPEPTIKTPAAASSSSISVREKFKELRKRMGERAPSASGSSDAESPKKKPRGKVTPIYGHRVRKSKKAGLTFPVGRIHRRLKEGRFRQRVSVSGAVYMAAVLEYMTAELIETAGNGAQDAGRKRIAPRDILLAVANDEEMDRLFKQAKVMIPGTGAIPSSDRFLETQRFAADLLKKRQKKKRAEEESGAEKKRPKKK